VAGRVAGLPVAVGAPAGPGLSGASGAGRGPGVLEGRQPALRIAGGRGQRVTGVRGR
jgi:hypothetical protein